MLSLRAWGRNRSPAKLGGCDADAPPAKLGSERGQKRREGGLGVVGEMR